MEQNTNPTLTQEQIAELVASVTNQKQEGQQQPQPFIFGNTQFESREAAERAIAEYVSQERQRYAKLQEEMEQIRQQQQFQTQAQPKTNEPPQFDKTKWADELVNDPRVGVSRALGWAAFGQDIDAGQALRETVMTVVQQKKQLEEMRATINEWQQRAANPHIPWDDAGVRNKIDTVMRQFNLPVNRDGYDMAVSYLERRNEIPKRDQWMAQLQAGQARQTNVQTMRPMGLPSVGPSSAQTPANFDDSMFDSMTDEQMEKLLTELKNRERQVRAAV